MKKGLALGLLSFMLVVTANAEVYRYKDSKGKTVFSDQPPSGQSVEKMFVRPSVGVPVNGPSQTSTDVKEPIVKRELPKNTGTQDEMTSTQLQAEVLKQQQTTSDLNQRVAEYNRKIKEDNCRRVTDNMAKAKSASAAVQAQLKKEQQEWCQ